MPHHLEKKIDLLVEALLENYSKGRTIDQVKAFGHPDKEAVIEIIDKLQKIIYPGYFRSMSYRAYTINSNISMIIEDVIYHLIKQMTIVLEYLPEFVCADESVRMEKAEELTFAFLHQIPKIREYIETDVRAAFDGDPAACNKDEIIFSYPGMFAVLVYRISHELHLLNIPLIPRMMTEYAHSVTGIDIHPGAVIGKYFFIDHGTGVVIGETTVIGDNVKIYQGVTIGALSVRDGQNLKQKKRHPTILDHVTIYSGASILGGETVIGKNVVIGSNAFITKSIPDGARVSIKNQELRYHYDAKHPEESTELEQDENWFYIV